MKGNDACNNTVANILHADPRDPWGGVKRSKFNILECGHAAYQIKEIPCSPTPLPLT